MTFDWTPRMYIASPTNRSRCRRLGEHAKLICRGVSALSCGTQPPRGPRGRRLSNFLHRRPDVQFIASRGIQHCADICSPGNARSFAEGSTFLQLQSRCASFASYLTLTGYINQRRVVTRIRVIRRSGSRFIMLSYLPFFLSLALCVLVR